MKCKRLVVAQRGGSKMLQLVEDELRPPAASEARARVLAAAVSLPDVEACYGRSPFPPKAPFTPSYAIAGRVDAVGGRVTQTQVGQQAAVLIVYGGYAEYVYVAELNWASALALTTSSIHNHSTATALLRVRRLNGAEARHWEAFNECNVDLLLSDR